MTTIAYKDGFMAADTLALDPNGLKASAVKIHYVDIGGDDWLFGSAGESSIAEKLRRSLGGVPTLEQVLNTEITCDPEDKNSAILCRGDVVLRKAGSMWFRHDKPYHAVGSGRDFALMAMRLGKSAAEAVELTLEFDGYSGGDVSVLEV